MRLPYLQLQTKSVCSDELLMIKDDSKFVKVYGENYVYPLNATALGRDTTIQKLIERFEIEAAKKITIFRLYPNTAYNWHTDGIRSCAINMQLSAFGDSMTLFGVPDSNRLLFHDVTKLNYQPNRFYLFNTGVSHSVYNFSQTRYLLSMGIPMKFSYEEVEDYILENNI